MKNLIEISKKYKTTKKMMGFINIYEKYLKEHRNKKINLLEIGVENGESLRRQKLEKIVSLERNL